jgi:PEGA domain
MDVGNDPFPRDEVTGLAAFENLEPVSGMNVLPEPAPEPAPQPVRTFNRPIGVSPVPSTAARGGNDDSERQDKTEILNLNGAEQVIEEEPSGEGYGWEDDAATSILTPAAFRTPVQSTQPAASLDMDWDEEEPPTRMRDEMPFLPPLGGSATHSVHDSWADEPNPEPLGRFDDLASAGYVPPADLPVPSPPVGRPSPFPQANSAAHRTYLAPIAQAPDRGGAPSPFSATESVAELPTGMASMLANRPVWQLVSAGAGVVLVVFLIGRLAFGGSSTAGVTITTAPSDAQVFIDGKPVSGTASPYSANELEAGQHELVVQKEGFKEYRTNFTVAKGESRALPMVELASKKLESAVAVNSMPSGAAISVDGAATGKTTPAKVTGLTPGVHKLQLALTGHNPFELSILVPESGVLQLPTAELAETSVAAATTAPARAKPEPREHREPREAREPREPREPVAASEKPRKSHAEPEPVVRAEPAPRSTGGAGGMLRLNSRPWSQVFVDGRLVGNTPQMGLPLSPGNHSIRLVNAQMGLTKTFSVSVKTGQMVTKVVNLVE